MAGRWRMWGDHYILDMSVVDEDDVFDDEGKSSAHVHENWTGERTFNSTPSESIPLHFLPGPRHSSPSLAPS